MEVIKCSRCRCVMDLVPNAKKIFKTCKQCRDKKAVKKPKQADDMVLNQADDMVLNQADAVILKQADVQITDDRQFNLYYEYSVINFILNKQKLRPFTIWIYKMRDVVNMIHIQHKIQIVIRHFKTVMNELVRDCAYPKWKYFFNSCIWEIEDKYTTYVNHIEIVNNMLL